MPECIGISTALSHLKTSFSGPFHAPRLDQYADRHLISFESSFNRRFHLAGMTD